MNYWGPQYRGIFGGMRKAKEFYFKPGMWPYTLGFLASTCILGSVPASKEDYKKSMSWNRREIMHKRYAELQTYHK